MALPGSEEVLSKDMTIEDLNECSNIFASEFNKADIHDRVLCFQFIINTERELETEVDCEDDERETVSFSQKHSAESMPFGLTRMWSGGARRLPAYSMKYEGNHEMDEKNEPGENEQLKVETIEVDDTKVVQEFSFVKQYESESYNMGIIDMEDPPGLLGEAKECHETSIYQYETSIYQYETKKAESIDEDTNKNVSENDQKRQNQTEEHQETCFKNLNEKAESCNEDNENKHSETTNDRKRSIVRKLFVHSQWLSVHSSYFKALFYSGMKETYSKEVVMKIYEYELEAHLVLIEAMYRLDVLKDKDYRLIVQVLVLAHKYDVRLVIKKCKYVLLSTTPSLEMCKHILQKTEHLTEMADVNNMLQTFLVKEFTPIDKTWTTVKFTELPEAALKLLLTSDDLPTQSENTIFVALMKWVSSNIPNIARSHCDLLHLVRFEFLSVDFLYDVVQNHSVACRMAGFNKCLLNGLAYHCFSEIRREQLEPKPKKRPSTKEDGPTFSWVIDKKIAEKLTKRTGYPIYSDTFWHKGYTMRLQLRYSDDLSKCSFYFGVCNLTGKACMHVSCRAKSNLFSKNTIKIEKHLFTARQPEWGYEDLRCNESQRGKGCTIQIWVEV